MFIAQRQGVIGGMHLHRQGVIGVGDFVFLSREVQVILARVC